MGRSLRAPGGGEEAGLKGGVLSFRERQNYGDGKRRVAARV